MNSVAPNLKGWLKNAKRPKYEKSAITSKRYEIGCQLVFNHWQEVAHRLSIGTDLGDLEWPWTA